MDESKNRRESEQKPEAPGIGRIGKFCDSLEDLPEKIGSINRGIEKGRACLETPMGVRVRRTGSTARSGTDNGRFPVFLPRRKLFRKRIPSRRNFFAVRIKIPVGIRNRNFGAVGVLFFVGKSIGIGVGSFLLSFRSVERKIRKYRRKHFVRKGFSFGIENGKAVRLKGDFLENLHAYGEIRNRYAAIERIRYRKPFGKYLVNGPFGGAETVRGARFPADGNGHRLAKVVENELFMGVIIAVGQHPHGKAVLSENAFYLGGVERRNERERVPRNGERSRRYVEGMGRCGRNGRYAGGNEERREFSHGTKVIEGVS